MRSWRIALAAAVLFCGLAPCFAETASIVLVTLDTTRADRMGFLGSRRNLTPNLDVFARDGVVFLRAYSQAPLTTTAHASILTGTYPQFHNVGQAGAALPPDLPYMPELLRVSGRRTAAFAGSMILQARDGGAPGFDRGFDEYNAGFHSRQPGESRYASIERRAAEVIAAAQSWIDKNPAAPFFLWIHLYDPHAPYDPPRPFAERYQSEPYDGEIAYVDSVLGAFFRYLREKKIYDSSLIAVMADHGESLGEHGERGHGLFLYDNTIRVPLVLKFPKAKFGGKRVASKVELVDVLPTILEAVELDIPKQIQGRSLLRRIEQPDDNAATDAPAYSETDYPQAFGWSPLQSLRTGKYLVVQAPRPELYDTSSDSAEQHNLAQASPAIEATIAAQLQSFRDKTSRSRDNASIPLTPGQAASIRSLGYVPSTGTQTAAESQSGIDPKDKVEISNQMTDAAFELEEGQTRKATERLESVMKKEPRLQPAYDALVLAWMRAGDLEQVVATLRKNVDAFPSRGQGHFQLGMTLIQARDLKAALPELELAAALSPTAVPAHYELARLYFNLDRMDDASKAAAATCSLDPRHYEANLMLGAIAIRENQPKAAIPYLQIASTTQPGSAKPHEYMARAYAALGDPEAAAREQSLAAQLASAGENHAHP